MRFTTLLKAACASAMLLSGSLHAAVLVGSVNTNPENGEVDLTAQGTIDWAIWDFRQASESTSPFPASVASTNRKETGSNLIGVISTVGGSGKVRGSGDGSLGLKNFTYSDGLAGSSLSPAARTGPVFNSALDNPGLGAGIQLSIGGNPNQEYIVNVWATGFNAQGTMTATLNDLTYTLQSQTYSGNKDATLFTFNYRPNNAGDLLNLSYVMTTDGAGTNSHVAIQAISISAVPEPSKSLMILMGMTGLICLRRRR